MSLLQKKSEEVLYIEAAMKILSIPQPPVGLTVEQLFAQLKTRVSIYRLEAELIFLIEVWVSFVKFLQEKVSLICYLLLVKPYRLK